MLALWSQGSQAHLWAKKNELDINGIGLESQDSCFNQAYGMGWQKAPVHATRVCADLMHV